jgi:two-component system chemotaxis response regulator CheY
MPVQPLEMGRAAIPPAEPPQAVTPPPVEPQPVAAPQVPPRPRQCLIVDDSRVVRKVSRSIVEKLGYQVMEAENGEEALARCKLAMPDLVLVDWDMPVMTGIEFVTALRASPGNERARVVFCTSKNGAHDIHRGIGAGANEYVTKPFNEVSLTAKLQAIGAV